MARQQEQQKQRKSTSHTRTQSSKVAANKKRAIVDQTRVALPGSERAPAYVAAKEGETTRQAARRRRITVSVILKPKQRIPAFGLRRTNITRAEYRRRHGADPAAIKLIRVFARESGLVVGDVSIERRTVKLSGAVPAIEKAFTVTLTETTIDGKTYQVQEGAIHLPRSLAGSVEAVLGLDNRPQAKPHFRVFASGPNLDAGVTGEGNIRAHVPGISYTPVQVAGFYQFPEGGGSEGQTIGIIELGGGYRKADLTQYFKALGLPVPQVAAVSVDGGKNSPGGAGGADGEVMLDIEVAAAVAPGVKIAVYFAPNTDQGFVDAVSTAVHDTVNQPGVISISWGGPEVDWSNQAIRALDGACQSAAVLGISITAAAGDSGASDGIAGKNVDFPASSPHVLACGGTSLTASGGAISSEVVWNDLASGDGATGGGVSNVFALPNWQTNAGVPKPSGSSGGRGVPDVAGDADPATGYQVRVDGEMMVIGGTSAVAPLWAGLIALNNHLKGQNAGFLQPKIYQTKTRPAFHDITSGNNGGFSAGPGWDACTGLGSPIGAKLIEILGTASASAKKKRGPRQRKSTRSQSARL